MGDERPRFRSRHSLLLGAVLMAALIAAGPARALEEAVIDLPLLQTQLSVKLRELTSAEALRLGSSDLADLDRATNGAVGRQVIDLLRQPVPLSLKQVTDGSVGTPLVQHQG